MNQSKHYTAGDIERYHSGQLSAAEMHALEKAALDDPFLADALEGYTFALTPVKDLSILQQKLQLRIEKEPKRRGLFYMSSGWMKVAALFVLIAGGGWLVFRTFSGDSNPERTELATSKPAEDSAQIVTLESPVADSTVTVFQAPTNSSFESNQLQDGITTNGEKRSTANGPGVVTANDPVIVQNRPQLEAFKKESYNGRIELDSVSSGYTSIGVPAFKVTAPDSVTRRSTILARNQNAAAARQQHPAAASKPSSFNDTIRNVNVVLQPSEASLAEVVVVNKNKFAERKDAQARMKIKVDTLEPAEGWTYFDDYIANNLKQPDELKTKPLRGEVELAFDIDKNGDPVNITIVRSLCQKCDEEAIRLLREGPKWKKGNKKGKVSIRF